MDDPRSLDRLCINTLRTLSIDAIQRADSGHPGLPLGAAPMAYVLWQRHLRHDPAHPDWPDRDRFVLSAGHGSMLLYALLHLTGYDLPLEEIQRFRQWGSRTPGHPEWGHTPGVEATTGPLGQGTANAVGMAMAERWLAERYNREGHTLVDHHTYALVSDGDLMEGIAQEAASLAGQLGLGKLIYLYDANGVTLDGPIDLCFSAEDVAARYRACGWQVQEVADGDHDLAGLDTAIEAAQSDGDRPSLIVVRTTLGYGSPAKAGTSAAHGAPLGEDEVRATKQALGWEAEESFAIPEEALAYFHQALDRGNALFEVWSARERAYAKAHPELHAEWRRALEGGLPEDFDADLPRFETGQKVATRVAGGKALNALAGRIPHLLGGDADLSSSTKTHLDGEPDFPRGRNLHFGVREHAMAAACNGMLYHGGVRPFCSTFFVFSDYLRPALRLAALSALPAIHVFTHDSVAVGEDGPTHQPVEQLMALRTMPGLVVLRPADANECVEAWRWIAAHRGAPCALVLSRQDLPVLDADAARQGVPRGAYVLHEAPGGEPQALLIATGSEVEVALEAQRALASEELPVRVVSMPSWELFARQPREYRDLVLPPSIRARVSLEAGVTLGWERWVGDGGKTLGIDRFGASAPGARVLEERGIHAAAAVTAVRELLAG